MFKVELKGELTPSKTLGVKKVWTIEFYVQIQKNLLQLP